MIKKLVSTFYRTRSRYWRLQRILFPSPAEVRFIELLGGRVVTFNYIKSNKTGFPLALIVSLGRILKQAKFKHEVRYGKYYVDFSNDLNWIIEIDGYAFHDVVADMDREIYIHEMLTRHSPYGMRILRVPAYRIYNNPSRVQRDVLKFITK